MYLLHMLPFNSLKSPHVMLVLPSSDHFAIGCYHALLQRGRDSCFSSLLCINRCVLGTQWMQKRGAGRGRAHLDHHTAGHTEALLAPTISKDVGCVAWDCCGHYTRRLDSKRAKTLKPGLRYKQRDTGMYLCMSVEETLAMRTCKLGK